MTFVVYVLDVPERCIVPGDLVVVPSQAQPDGGSPGTLVLTDCPGSFSADNGTCVDLVEGEVGLVIASIDIAEGWNELYIAFPPRARGGNWRCGWNSSDAFRTVK